MNIFDWMHRKLNPSMEYYGKVSHQKVRVHGKMFKCEELERKEIENEAPLLELGVFDGILAIGTLGHVGHYYQHEEFDSNDGDLHENEPKITELAYNQELIQKRSEGFDVKVSLKCLVQEGTPEIHIEPNSVTQDEAEEKLVEPLLKEERRARTTLKDLFLASDEIAKKEKREASTLVMNGLKVKDVPAKLIGGRSHENKETETPPMSYLKKVAVAKVASGMGQPAPKKLCRLLSKMVRKKIYPEMERGQQLQDKGSHVDGSVSSMLTCVRSHAAATVA